MQIRTAEETFNIIQECAHELLEYAKQKKAIDVKIKECKQTYKEEGIAVGKVQKIINKIKARAKQTEADILEEDIIEERLEADTFVQDSVAELNAN